MSGALDLLMIVLAIIWWFWFGQRMNGIHAETKRAADALDAINTREMRAETKARAKEMQDAIASADAIGTPAIDAEAERIREETRRRAGL